MGELAKVYLVMPETVTKGKTYKSTEKTLSILKGHVRVVPSAAILADLELIGLHLTGSQRTLSNTRNTILCDSVELTYAMPVDGSTVVDQIVCDMNLQGVTPIGLYTRISQYMMLRYPRTRKAFPGKIEGIATYKESWARNSPVVSQAGRVVPIWRAGDLLDVEPVLSRNTSVRDSVL